MSSGSSAPSWDHAYTKLIIQFRRIDQRAWKGYGS